MSPSASAGAGAREPTASTWIRAAQREWADAAGLRIDELGYCNSPELHMPWLTPRIRAEIEDGDGNEFTLLNGRAKICALHSSSALAVNLFGYWADNPPPALAAALGMRSVTGPIRFERKYPTGISCPNVDVEIGARDGSLVAVESKFEESYRKPTQQRTIKESYFPDSKGRWSDVGLPGAQQAADAIRSGEPFFALDAPQLLKHMLGLARRRSHAPSDANSVSRPRVEWRLLLLWYQAPGLMSKEVQAEIDRFSDLLGADAARFDARTYQDV